MGLLLLCAIWGFTQVTIKVANAGFSPLLQAGLRSAGSALLLWAWSAYRGVPLLRAVLFVYTAPFVVAVGAHFFVPGERLHRLKVAGLGCAFAGVSLAFADALRLPTRAELLGDALCLGGAVCWGATTVAVKAARRAALTPNKTIFYA